MDIFCKSIGPEAGSSGRKKKYAFSPLPLVKSHFLKNSYNRPKSFFKCSSYKMTCSLVTFFIFILVAIVRHIFNEIKPSMSGLTCLETRNHPGWLGDFEKLKQNKNFSFFPPEKIEKLK